MTTVADGLYQFGGAPVGVNPFFNKIFSTTYPERKGRAWFVDASSGVDGNGESPQKASATMDKIFDKLASGDIIYAIGNIREQLVTPVQVFDVTIIGCGNRPRNADAVPAGGNWGAVTWRAPASGGTAAQATLRILQQGWTIYNILFNMIDTNAAGIEIVRNAGADDAERDASHASIIGCRFAGAGIGIRSGVAGSFTENTTNVLVQGNTFLSNTTAILQTAGFGGLNWQIKDNDFITCTNDIVGPFSATKIIGNRMSLAPTASIVLTGGAGNMVHYNALPGTYAAGALYAPGTSDDWNGNAASTGFTAAVPA
jgi:hypothetical protein